MKSFKQSFSTINTNLKDNGNYRTSYNMAFTKPDYYIYQSKSRNNINNNFIERYKNEFKTSNNDSENIKQLLCPDCFNRHLSNEKEVSKQNINYLDRNIPKSFVDNLYKEDEKFIKDRIKEREFKTNRASKYLKNIRDYNINKLQNENQNANFFDTNREYGIFRAKKRDYLNNNYVMNMKNYLNLDNPKVNDYYKKYVNNNKEEDLIKERPLSMSKEDYNQMMINQIKQNKKLKDQREYSEKLEDERIVKNQMFLDKKKTDEENRKRKAEIDYYQDENLKLLYSKKLRDQAEDNDRKYEENKIIKENEKQIQKENEKSRIKRQKYLDINKENYKNYKLKKERELREKEIESNKKYPGLCIHGSKMGKCDICNRIYPERILTQVLYKKRNKTSSKY